MTDKEIIEMLQQALGDIADTCPDQSTVNKARAVIRRANEKLDDMLREEKSSIKKPERYNICRHFLK